MAKQTDAIALSTRSIDCIFEPETGFLRYVRSGNCELLRAIYGAVRDQDWNTVEPQVTIRELKRREDYFRVSFLVQCSLREIQFGWEGTIEADGLSLVFRFEGAAKSTFKKNRIGLCILHPIRECAGRPCRAEQVDGSWVEGEFPLHIAPHQPFKNFRRLVWQSEPELKAELTLNGETFEMEDQRNWTDASFKTYGTPLELPFPVTIQEGDFVVQSAELRVTSSRPSRPASSGVLALRFAAESTSKPMPQLGLCVASHGQALTSTEIKRLAELRLDHLRVDLHLSSADWERKYLQADAQANSISASLHAALFLTNDAESQLRKFIQLADLTRVKVCFIFHVNEKSTSQQWLMIAKRLMPGLTLVAGTNAYFAELNRQRPPRGFPAVYSISPQVHAIDDLSLFETLEAQPSTVESGLRFVSDSFFISPITLRPRFNPNATGMSADRPGELPAAVDPRQRLMQGALWTLGTIGALGSSRGVASLTFFESTGWRGLMETDTGSPIPEQFPSEPGEIFPVYSVFSALAGAKTIIQPTEQVPNGLAAFGFKGATNGKFQCAIGNIRRAPSTLRLQVPGEEIAGFRISDRGAFENFSAELDSGQITLELGGYSITILQCL
ncbi:MAG: hypothetical protein JO076_01485 [Verrucomicrobia bacterium]|nr:hypothetical protein [Verrucomicrobiota bacterium]